MRYGNIIFLNGTSSSGKSSLAKELQENLEEIHLHISLDDIWPMFPEKILKLDDWHNTIDMKNYISGFHKTIASYANAGVDVIVDHCCIEPIALDECVELFKDSRVIFVEVICSIDELRKREAKRDDRKVGQAESQIPLFNKFRQSYRYDIQVDTSANTSSECARMIIDMLNDKTLETAFGLGFV